MQANDENKTLDQAIDVNNNYEKIQKDLSFEAKSKVDEFFEKYKNQIEKIPQHKIEPNTFNAMASLLEKYYSANNNLNLIQINNFDNKSDEEKRIPSIKGKSYEEIYKKIQEYANIPTPKKLDINERKKPEINEQKKQIPMQHDAVEKENELLKKKLQSQKGQIDYLKAKNKFKKERNTELQSENESLKNENERLREELQALKSYHNSNS